MTNKPRPTIMWVIGHPQIPNRAFVLADNWELATVAAAAYWGVPWAKVAAECFKIESHEARRNVCIRCHAIYYGEGPMCAPCMEREKSDRINAQRAARDYWTRKNREWKERIV